MLVAIRVDASVNIGTGHVMRCLTLAKEMKARGADVHFICRDFHSNMSEIIKKEGFTVCLLSGRDAYSEKTQEVKMRYQEWLGVSWEKDAEQVREILDKRESWTLLVVDHYGVDAKWEREVKKSVSKLMVIDDLANRGHYCDVLLDQNFYVKPEARYTKLVPPNCKLMLGPKYALLRKEFTHDLKIKDCDLIGRLKNIFVFMGGSDPTNETEKALMALDKASDLEVKANVVVSSVNPRADIIEAMCIKRSYCNFHKDINNIGELMLEADLAIGAGGATTLERCFVGLPSLVIVVANNQKETTASLDDVGAIRNIGWYSDMDSTDIYNNLLELINDNDNDRLKKMCKSSRDIFCAESYSGINGVVDEALELS